MGVAVVLSAAIVAACSGQPPAGVAGPGTEDGDARATPATSSPEPDQDDEAAATPSNTPGPDEPEQIRLAFAGDIHFERQLRQLLDAPAAALDPIRPVLSDADVTMVNLETAVTSGGTAEPKNYTFRADSSSFDALAAAGVDVVTMANNHGVDYGADGLRDTLDAASGGPVAVVGIGANSDDAFAPHVVRVGDTRIAFFGATAFPDPTTDNWPAGPDQPGVAVSIDPERLLAEVRAARETADVVVTYVHWGIERMSCPTAEQRSLAAQLAEAGADVVVGSHAHVQQGAGLLDDTYVAYGLGNFVWYTRNSAAEGTTGVLTLTLEGRAVVDSGWTPALVGEDGLPTPVPEADAAPMIEDFAELRSCTDLAASPGLTP